MDLFETSVSLLPGLFPVHEFNLKNRLRAASCAQRSLCTHCRSALAGCRQVPQQNRAPALPWNKCLL